MKGNKHMKTTTKIIYLTFAVAIFTLGALTANGAPGDLFVSINGNGANGGGSIYQYKRTTGVFRIAASGLSRPRGVAFNRVGNLFVTNTTFDGTTNQASIVKITPRGVQSTVATLSGNLFGTGVAFDPAGNLFVMAGETDFTGTIYKITPDGVISTFGNTTGQAFGIAFDSAGNLFAASGTDQMIYKFTPDGARSVFVGPSAFTPNAGPVGLAFDSLGNLFVSTESGCPPLESDSILKFTPDGVETTFATDLMLPRGLAFDPSGNLFLTELLCDTTGSDILEFRPDGTRRVFAVVSGQTNSGPEWLAFQPR
jgi:sugar lactone lactonase YvrE